jgi:TATA-box binding protein (TBP) (component of TFIID and TFIIIB)
MDNLRISTMTAICNISDEIDLKMCYDKLEINDLIHFIELKGYPDKGFSKKSQKKKRKIKDKKVFYNQITLHVFDKKVVNVKIFNNGRIQMTGLKFKEQGINVINKLIKEIKKYNTNECIFSNELKLSNYNIVLINSDFDIKYKVNRDLLHRDIIGLGMYSSYEPTIYPGVNIKYYDNKIYNDGICRCCNKCNGKGKGNGDGDCKKITIAVFNSGKIIITGGNSFEQVITSYNFIYNLLNNKEKYENIIDDTKNMIENKQNSVNKIEKKYMIKLK